MDPFEELAFQDFYRVGMDERAIEATRFDQEIWNRWKIIKRFTTGIHNSMVSFFLSFSFDPLFPAGCFNNANISEIDILTHMVS